MKEEEPLKKGQRLLKEDKRPEDAVVVFKEMALGNEDYEGEALKKKESAIEGLVESLVEMKDQDGLKNVLVELRPMFGKIAKAKTAKIVRTVIDGIAKIPDSTETLMTVCQEQADWARAEKRSFLRQRIDMRLATLYLSTKNYTGALKLLGTLLSEVKRLDDKLLLVEIHILESKVHHALRNLPKARAALVSARTAANAVYVAPSIQADMDTQSGILHGEDKDFKTAYSYFYEAFEQLSALDDPKAVPVLKYMLLSKIMAGDIADVAGIITSKAGLKYAGSEVEALKAVAKAYESRSLAEFQRVLGVYVKELQEDPVIHSHLQALYNELLEQNLLRIVEPYSKVDVSCIASRINLPVHDVEAKLSQMILDKRILGTLDQGVGTLEVFEEETADSLYPAALDTIDNLGKVVDSLFARSLKIA